MPLGAITGKEDFMKKFNDIFFSTTYGGETLSIAVGIAVVDEYLSKKVIEHSWNMGKTLKDGINTLGQELDIKIGWVGTPVRGQITFSDEYEVSPKLLYSVFLQECIKGGVMFGPGETLISYSHTKEDIENTLNVCRNALMRIKTGLDQKNVTKLLEGKEMKTVMTF